MIQDNNIDSYISEEEKEINVDSLWIINERGKGGKRSNVYHGNFIPQIPNQLIRRYTKENDTVLELFTGSGTTLYECEDLNRNYIGFDINDSIINDVNQKMLSPKIKYHINNCDVTNRKNFVSCMNKDLQAMNISKTDFLIAHPPYLDIIHFTNKAEDLSNISDLNTFLDKLTLAISNALDFLDTGKYFAIVMGDIYKNSEVIPLGFYTMNAIKKTFNVKLKGIIVKNIEGNRGKLGVYNIWKYRALKSDYFLFKHEYIFVFKKEF